MIDANSQHPGGSTISLQRARTASLCLIKDDPYRGGNGCAGFSRKSVEAGITRKKQDESTISLGK